MKMAGKMFDCECFASMFDHALLWHCDSRRRSARCMHQVIPGSHRVSISSELQHRTTTETVELC